MDDVEPGPSGSGPSSGWRESGPWPEGHGSALKLLNRAGCWAFLSSNNTPVSEMHKPPGGADGARGSTQSSQSNLGAVVGKFPS